MAEENGQELPDLSDQGFVLFRLDLTIVCLVLLEAACALRLKSLDEREELADKEDQIGLLQLLSSDVQQVRSGVLSIRQTVEIKVCHAQGQLDKELGRPHHLHERTNAILPGVICVARHFKRGDD